MYGWQYGLAAGRRAPLEDLRGESSRSCARAVAAPRAPTWQVVRASVISQFLAFRTGETEAMAAGRLYGSVRASGAAKARRGAAVRVMQCQTAVKMGTRPVLKLYVYGLYKGCCLDFTRIVDLVWYSTGTGTLLAHSGSQ